MLRSLKLAPEAARRWQEADSWQRLAVLHAAEQLTAVDCDMKALSKLKSAVLVETDLAWPADNAPLLGVLSTEQAISVRLRKSELVGLAVTKVLLGSKLYNEVYYAAKWAAGLGRQFSLEVVCQVGRADIVLSDEVIEAKYTHGWKGALGQALAYKHCLGKQKAGLLLIGEPATAYRLTVEATCKAYDVAVYWLPIAA
jgi:hypothetical protein